MVFCQIAQKGEIEMLVYLICSVYLYNGIMPMVVCSSPGNIDGFLIPTTLPPRRPRSPLHTYYVAYTLKTKPYNVVSGYVNYNFFFESLTYNVAHE